MLSIDRVRGIKMKISRQKRQLCTKNPRELMCMGHLERTRSLGQYVYVSYQNGQEKEKGALEPSRLWIGAN